MSWLADWSKRIPITLDSSKIDSDETDFPCTIKLSASSGLTARNLSSIFTDISYANRKKIAVTNYDGLTQLYVEIESWDVGNKIAILHVKIPNLISYYNQRLYLYYDSTKGDNSSYVGDVTETAAKSVWNSNYVLVMHMNQSPTGGANCIKDSSSYSNHGTPYGSMTSGDLVNSFLGKGLDFDGLNDYIQVADASSLDLTTSMTITVNFKMLSSQTGYRVLINKAADSGNWRLWQIEVVSNGVKVLQTAIRNSSDGASTAGGYINWKVGQYYTLNSVFDKITLKLLVDGVKFGSEPSHTENLITSAGPIRIGCGWWSSVITDYANCVLDEVRISNVARSLGWNKTENFSFKDQLLTFGAVQLYLQAESQIQATCFIVS